MKVKILSDGIHAKEVNPLGREPVILRSKKYTTNKVIEDKFSAALEVWQQAESKLRTFEIAQMVSGGEVWYNTVLITPHLQNMAGSIHTAEILPNGKIKITS